IINTVTQARVNAHGTRHLLSAEVWEAINKFYHFVNNYSQEVFVTTGLFDLTTKLNELSSIIREKILRTLLHDEVWALLMLGIHLERAFQMIRLINTKLYDIEKIKLQLPHDGNLVYEWATLLRCAETYDMSKKFYRKVPNSQQTLEFLLLNRSNPKSLISNIEKVNSYVGRISDKKGIEPEMIEFKIGKLLSTLTYLTMDEIEEDRTAFILDSFDQLNGIGASFEKDYLFF
ncbi:MAG: alpha-E domain-containing protein, partial [Bacteroidota bacterium]